MPLGDQWQIGLLGIWSNAQFALSESSESTWFSALSLGPAVGLTMADWCLNASLTWGHGAAEWTHETQRLTPTVLGCFAPSTKTLFRVGVSGPIAQFGLRPFPLLGWKYRNGAFQTDALLPVNARALYWLSGRWSVGILASGDALLWSTPGSPFGEELGILATYTGAVLLFQPYPGISVTLGGGANWGLLIRNENKKNSFEGAPQPMGRAQLILDQSLLGGR